MSGPENLGFAVLIGLGVWLAVLVGCGVGLRGRLRTIVMMLLALPIAAWGAAILVELAFGEPEPARLYGLIFGSAFLAVALGFSWWASRSWSKPRQA